MTESQVGQMYLALCACVELLESAEMQNVKIRGKADAIKNAKKVLGFPEQNYTDMRMREMENQGWQ